MAAYIPGTMDLARRRRGMTKKSLAEQIGITPEALRLFEAQKRSPGNETLQRAANALEFPVSFFTTGRFDEPEVESVSFRSKASMTATQRDQAIGSATIATALADWIEQRFELPAPAVPRLRVTDPELAAAEVRATWGLGPDDTTNMVHLLESKGVRIFSLAEECRSVDAFSYWRGETPYIFLNTMKSGERSRMDAAHELGHLVMHYWGGPDGRDAEDEAKAFAGAFLMPVESVTARVRRPVSVPQIVAAKHQWRVAAVALAYRLKTLGLLTEWEARHTFRSMSVAGYRNSEPEPIAPEQSLILAKVLAAARAEGVSVASIAASLHVPTAELHKLLFGLAVSVVEGDSGPDDPSRPPNRPTLRAVPS